MTTMTEMLLDVPAPAIDTPVKGVDFDPSVGSGAMLDEMDAPEDYSSSHHAYDPWV